MRMGGLGGNQNDRMEKRAEGVQMAKTIKQIADEIGVSKQAVSYRLKQLEKENDRQILAVKENGFLAVSLVGETLLKSAFAESDRQTLTTKEPPKDRQRDDDILAVLKGTIDTLQDQNETNNKQLETKDKQISELNDRLAECSAALVAAQQTAQAAQALHAGTIQQQITAGGADPAEQVTSTKKKRWWNWK